MAQNLTTPLLVITAIAASFLIAVWISLIIWTARDIRKRSQDKLVIFLSVASIVLLNFIGYIIYLILRPTATLFQEYQQALEEEALLQSLEPQHRCSACGLAVNGNWQYCPFCQNRLMTPCANCQTLLQSTWIACPNCGLPVAETNEPDNNETLTDPNTDSNALMNRNNNEDLLIEETDIESL